MTSDEAAAEIRPWCWRVRFYFKVRNGAYLNTHESSCDGAFPEGTTALQAITEVAKWRGIDLDAVYAIEAERLIPDPHDHP